MLSNTLNILKIALILLTIPALFAPAYSLQIENYDSIVEESLRNIEQEKAFLEINGWQAIAREQVFEYESIQLNEYVDWDVIVNNSEIINSESEINAEIEYVYAQYKIETQFKNLIFANEKRAAPDRSNTDRERPVKGILISSIQSGCGIYAGKQKETKKRVIKSLHSDKGNTDGINIILTFKNKEEIDYYSLFFYIQRKDPASLIKSVAKFISASAIGNRSFLLNPFPQKQDKKSKKSLINKKDLKRSFFSFYYAVKRPLHVAEIIGNIQTGSNGKFYYRTILTPELTTT